MERFDASLSRYKPQFESETVIVESKLIDSPTLDLAELWEKYMVFKKSQISQSTYAVDYRKYRNHITSLPTRNLENATTVRDHLVANLTPNAARRVLTNINACCNWALKSRLIEVNPFIGMASEINIPKSEQEDTDIRSFNREERDQIIEAFESNKTYNYYAPLVKFLFFTGCRPSEAIALQWKHISADWRFVTFEQAYTISLDGFALKGGLKTQASRKFPINNQLRASIESYSEGCPSRTL